MKKVEYEGLKSKHENLVREEERARLRQEGDQVKSHEKGEKAFAHLLWPTDISTYKCPHHGFEYIKMFGRNQIPGMFLMPSKITSWHTSSSPPLLNSLTNVSCNTHEPPSGKCFYLQEQFLLSGLK